MKFFFPDSHDLVDPSFDFQTERRSPTRVRHQGDQYAHEVFDEPPYSGLLISKAIVDGTEKGSGKYTTAQRLRLLRNGVREFFRIGERPLETIGDCGAFSYVKERTPPYSVDEVLSFYDQGRFDYGVSVDHIILGFQAADDAPTAADAAALESYRERQSITLDLARDFLNSHRKQRLSFVPVGVAQGWSPASYADSTRKLQSMGYEYIGVGGLVPLKTEEILAVLHAINPVRRAKTKLHLFGVNRCEHLAEFERYGVVSFDSTSPLLQAFKHDRENYYTLQHKYSAIRVPQVEGNMRLASQIRSGKVDQDNARRLEKACLAGLSDYDSRGRGLASLIGLLREYDLIHDGRKDRTEDYRRVLTDHPWKTCRCRVCRDLGIHVVIFRGAERNRRRGFHNLFVVHQQFHQRRDDCVRSDEHQSRVTMITKARR
jgi:hypothetical protein